MQASPDRRHQAALGFWYKWNWGGCDTLDYMKLDPVYRQYHHDKLTFGLLYNYTENFMLPLSHDEVVHGKNPFSTVCRAMRGRSLPTCAPTTAGCLPSRVKLLFMGNEFAQGRSGTTTPVSTGICWKAAITGTTACSVWCVT